MARRYKQINKERPLILICSEGGKKSSEYYYFRNFSNRHLRIQFSRGNETDPKGMVKDLLKYIDKEDIKSEEICRIFLVIDTDLDDNRINEIKSIKEVCEKNNIEIITSAPTFEIWYLMHYKSSKLKYDSSQAVKKELKNKMKDYSETLNIYSRIQNTVDIAMEKAKKIEQISKKNNEDIIKTNPHSDIYKIIDAIDKFNNLM